MESYYILREGKKVGPIDPQKMETAIDKGIVKAETKVWTKGMQTWAPAIKTPLSVYFREGPPAVPSGDASNKYAWMLATIPIITGVVCALLGLGIVATVIQWILNTVFLLLDKAELDKSDCDIGAIIWLGLVLVPVYLFVRSAKVDRNYGYSVTWCILFIVLLVL